MEIEPQEHIANLLSRMAQAVKRLRESEIEAFLSGDFRIEIVVGGKGRKPSAHKPTIGESDCRQIADELTRAADRNAGMAILSRRCPSKSDLILLARLLDLPVQKRENVDRITEKVIEATIGFRLRSRAVQGTEKSG